VRGTCPRCTQIDFATREQAGSLAPHDSWPNFFTLYGGKVTHVELEDTTIYKVVLNQEEQYSLWPADKPNPLGWRDAGKGGPKSECLSYIEEAWSDMRPLSIRGSGNAST
jgi:MbtH protein